MIEIIKVTMCCNSGEKDFTEEFKSIFITKKYNIRYDSDIIDLFPGKHKYLDISYKENDISSNCKLIQYGYFPKRSRNSIIDTLRRLKVKDHVVYTFIQDNEDVELHENHICMSLFSFNNKKCIVFLRPCDGAGIYCCVNYFKGTIKMFMNYGFDIKMCTSDAFSLYKNADENVYEFLFKEGQPNDENITRKFFSPSDMILNRISELELKYNVDTNNCIGVVYRGTDKIIECTLPKIESYFEKIDAILLKESDIKVLLQTDVESVHTKFRSIYGDKLISFDEIPRSSNEKNVFHTIERKNRLEVVSYFESAIRIISKCKYAFTNDNSNITGILYDYGNGNNVVKIPPAKPTLESNYNSRCFHPCDINQHLPTLAFYASKCQTITEFGVRTANSSYGLLYGKPKELLSYDIENVSSAIEVKRIANENNINYKFTVGDTKVIDIKQTDLLFIDTLHTYSQLLAELYRHSKKVISYIILHDTVSYGNIDQGENVLGPQKGLLQALNQFLSDKSSDGNNWVVERHYLNNNGLTILKRKCENDVIEEPKIYYGDKIMLPMEDTKIYYGTDKIYVECTEKLKDVINDNFVNNNDGEIARIVGIDPVPGTRKSIFAYGKEIKPHQRYKESLSSLFDKYSCTKNSTHHYGTVYDQLFFKQRLGYKNVLEIGVWHGASIKAMSEYFSNATIYGIDVNPKISEIKNIPTNANLVIGDATTEIGLSTLSNIEFDLIIDDGSHKKEDQVKSFGLLYEKLKVGGYYVIEDIVQYELVENDKSFFNKFVVIDLTDRGVADSILMIYRKS